MIKTNQIILAFLLFMFTVSCQRNPVPLTTELRLNVMNFGADPTGENDSSLAFKNALKQKGPKVIVPAGIYRIDQTIELMKHLFLEAGVKIIRKQKSQSTSPIFHLTTSYATLEGENKRVQIKTMLPLTEGIIKVGHTEGQKGKNILYCTIKNLTITGPGYDNEKKCIGIKMFSSQLKGDNTTASFFHEASQLILEHMDYGVFMKGMVNANSVHNVILNRVGNNPSEGGLVIKGSMENRIYDIFHHFSPDATTVHIEALKIKEQTLIPSYNTLFGIVSEQNGDNARCLNMEAGKHNDIRIQCNAKGENYLYDKFKNNNNQATF